MNNQNERTLEIIKMLGWDIHPDTNNECFTQPDTWDVVHFSEFDPKDYVWLMELVEFVESKGYEVFINGLYCRITDSGMTNLEIESGKVSNKKEAIFMVISDFAKYYNENKFGDIK